MAVVDLDLYDIFEEAFEMAGESYHTGYDIRIARRALNFLMDEWANRGLNLWTVAERTIPCVVGTDTYVLPTDTVDVLEHVIRSVDGTLDYPIRRLAVGEYSKLTLKQLTSRPTTIYIERLIAPQVTLWPVPDAAYTLVYWALTRLEGLSTGTTGTPDMPNRFRPALCAGIAKRIAMVRQKLNLIPMLSGEYEAQFQLAADEDRDRASYYMRPEIGKVT